MKHPLFLLFASSPLLLAGSPANVAAPTASPSGNWLTPLIDIRTRYEFADVSPLDPSHAWTFRERLGVKTTSWSGFSALVEGEFSQAAVDDYHGAARLADPFDLKNSPIADPETAELNQALLQYQYGTTTAKLGRQRIIYDNAEFIGNVGWRQNEQTYDAFSITDKTFADLTLNYAWVNQINRIFGSDADSAVTATNTNVQDLAADIHLFNASYAGIKGLTLGGYAYLMNVPAAGAWDNRTIGISAKRDLFGLTCYGEAAWQDQAGTRGDAEASYYHLTATKDLKFGGTALGSTTLGLEHLDAGFKTPLATVHAFNGFADVTDAARINGSHNGLTNLYLAHTLPICFGIKWTNTLHAMGDDEISTGYGWEYDSVLAKKFDDHFTAIAKFAWFNTEGDPYAGATPLPDATRVSVELNYTF